MYSQIGCGAADKVAEGSLRVSWARGQVAIRDPLILHIHLWLSVAREAFAARKHENANSAVRAPATAEGATGTMT